jgi:hypothetical protein
VVAVKPSEERTRDLLGHADWLRALEEFADEGHRLAPKLALSPHPRLREAGERVRRAADFEFATRTLGGA